MPSSLVPALGYLVAAALGGLAIYYWRRSNGLYSLLVEGANRYEELRQRNGQLEQAGAKADEKAKLHREQTGRLEKSVDDARERAAEVLRKLEAKEHELRLVTEKLELQKGHLEKELAKAGGHLHASEVQRDEQAVRAAAQLADLEQRLAVLRQEGAIHDQDAQLRERDLLAKLREADKEREGLDLKLKTAKAGPLTDAAELLRYKRKVVQYDRLYASMKGLREMSDERNRNWEVALHRLSSWIIRETHGPLHTLPGEIGPLVGQALQAIGAQLIDDGENGPGPRVESHGGARRADDMDGLPEGDSGVDVGGDEAREAALHPERASRLQGDV